MFCAHPNPAPADYKRNGLCGKEGGLQRSFLMFANRGLLQKAFNEKFEFLLHVKTEGDSLASLCEIPPSPHHDSSHPLTLGGSTALTCRS